MDFFKLIIWFVWNCKVTYLYNSFTGTEG